MTEMSIPQKERAYMKDLQAQRREECRALDGKSYDAFWLRRAEIHLPTIIKGLNGPTELGSR